MLQRSHSVCLSLSFFLFLSVLFILFSQHRNLSTKILFSLNSLWFHDRKHFYQTFRSHVQRIGRALALYYTAIDHRSIHSIAVASCNAIARPFNEHVWRSIERFAKLPLLAVLQLNFIVSFAYPYVRHISLNHFTFSHSLVYAMQMMLMPIATFSYVR